MAAWGRCCCWQGASSREQDSRTAGQQSSKGQQHGSTWQGERAHMVPQATETVQACQYENGYSSAHVQGNTASRLQILPKW
jgi:hypothetical protein